MLRKKLLHVVSALALAGVMATIGCTDSNYDLGNLNKTIAIGSDEGFELPGNNSTSDMILDDLLDLEDNDVIQVASDGTYFFSRGADEDEVDAAEPVVDEIPLTQVGSENDFDYDLGGDLEDEARSLAPSDGNGSAKEIFSFSFEKAEDFDNLDVLGISLAELRAGINIDFTFSEELKKQIGYLKELTIDLPDFFDIDVEPLYKDKYAMAFDKEKNIIKFNNLTEDGVHCTLKLNGMNFPEIDKTKSWEEIVQVIADEHGYYLYFTPEKVSVYGGIWLDSKYDETAAARAGIRQKQNLKIHCHSSIDETVMLTKATGYFNPEIKLGKEGQPIGEFRINNLPDFLDDEDVHLSVDNPELRVWVSSNMDVRGYIKDATIVAYDSKGKPTEIQIDTEKETLFIDPHTGKERSATGDSLETTKTTIIITDKPFTGKREPNTYYGTPKNGKKLGDLLYNVPDRVTFDCSVAADSTYEGTIQLGYKDAATKEPWYKIQPSYEVYAPLAFTKDACIVYRDSITGWHKDMEDITLSNGAEIIITATVINGLPLDLTFKAKAIELVGNEAWTDLSTDLIDVIVTDFEGNDLKIKANSSSRMKIRLVQKRQEGFKRIDGIAFVASALGNDNSPALNSRTQKVKVDRIGISLKGKVIVDLDD